jgi:hypothetical protein
MRERTTEMEHLPPCSTRIEPMKESKPRWALALALAICAGPLVYVGAASGQAEQGATQYYGRNQCGIVDVTRLPPRTYLTVDVDGDGEPEHYIANWGGVAGSSGGAIRRSSCSTP